MQNIVQEQFLLAKNGISLMESLMLPDFEREAFVSLAIEWMKMERESMSHLADS